MVKLMENTHSRIVELIFEYAPYNCHSWGNSGQLRSCSMHALSPSRNFLRCSVHRCARICVIHCVQMFRHAPATEYEQGYIHITHTKVSIITARGDHASDWHQGPRWNLKTQVVCTEGASRMSLNRNVDIPPFNVPQSYRGGSAIQCVLPGHSHPLVIALNGG